MTHRLLSLLLAVLLVSGTQLARLHVHYPAHGGDEQHHAFVHELDADHAAAHAAGAVDADQQEFGSHTPTGLPDDVAAQASGVPAPQQRKLPFVRADALEQRLTGPPSLLAPPGHAPPATS